MTNQSAMDMTDASDIESYLYSLKGMGPKLGLERMERLLHALGNPEKGFKSVLVAGTNGKGSTVAIIRSILQAAGYRTGSYTSPHLSVLNERISVDDGMISDGELIDLVLEIKDVVERKQAEDPGFEGPTFFEMTTAAAFLHFKRKKVDFSVVEVGLGGRLDATNTLMPLVSVITNISLEHTEILGDTIAKIATEKGGIIKDNGILVTGSEDKDALKVFERVCREKGSKILRVGRDIDFERVDDNEMIKAGSGIKRVQRFALTLPQGRYELGLGLLGRHQLHNAACAGGVVHALRGLGIAISDDALREGMLNASWPGRMEIVQEKPLVMLDCAKDAEAARNLSIAFEETVRRKRLFLVVSISADKRISQMLGHLVPISDVVIATAHKVMGRAADPRDLAKEVAGFRKETIIVPDVREAVERAISMAGPDDAILVTGSVFAVGEAREIWFPSGKRRFGPDFNETPRK